jgi:hypothetical protein
MNNTIKISSLSLKLQKAVRAELYPKTHNPHKKSNYTKHLPVVWVTTKDADKLEKQLVNYLDSHLLKESIPHKRPLKIAEVYILRVTEDKILEDDGSEHYTGDFHIESTILIPRYIISRQEREEIKQGFEDLCRDYLEKNCKFCNYVTFDTHIRKSY